MRLEMFYCPKSCNGKYREDMAEIVKTVEEAGLDFNYYELTDESLEAITALSTDADIIVVAGGDGTVNRVFNATYRLDKPYIILPFGSGNDFAKTFDCPKTGKELLRTIEDMKTSTTDLWELNEKYVFVQSIFVGLSIKTIEIKEELGCNGYLKPIIKALKVYVPEYMRVCTENAIVEGNYLIAALQNVRTTCNGLKMTCESKVDDGCLEILLCPYLGKFRLFMNLLATKLSWVCKQPNATTLKTKDMYISGNSDITYTVDGEIRRSKDLKIRLSDKKATIIHL